MADYSRDYYLEKVNGIEAEQAPTPTAEAKKNKSKIMMSDSAQVEHVRVKNSSN